MFGETCGFLTARFRNFESRLTRECLGATGVTFELGEFVVARIETCQTLFECLTQGYELLAVVEAVTVTKRIDGAETLVDFNESRGVGVEIFVYTFECCGDVRQFDAGRVKTLGYVVGLRQNV